MRRFSGRRTKEVQGVKGGEGGRAREKKSSARATSQIIVLELCSVCARTCTRTHTKLSLASTFSSQLKAKRYNASFSVSPPDDSFLLLVLRKIGKMFLYIFQQSVLLFLFPPPPTLLG